jgi:hypothetical protein
MTGLILQLNLCLRFIARPIALSSETIIPPGHFRIIYTANTPNMNLVVEGMADGRRRYNWFGLFLEAIYLTAQA